MPVHVGDVGRAVSPLSPSGAVEVNGARLDARSEGLPIEAGAAVVVLRGDPTGYVVRALVPGAKPLPNHGEPIRKADFQMKGADVAEAEREERLARRRELFRQMRWGSVLAATLGMVAGLASALLGTRFDWASVNELMNPQVLLGGSVGVGAIWAVLLYFFTGWFTVYVLPSEADAVFEPDFLATAAGLLGAALGFWLNLGGEPVMIAAWSAGLSLGVAAVAAGIAWVVGTVT